MDKKELTYRLDKLTSVIVRNIEDRCATCGKKLLKKQRQAGHFIPRVVKQTRWDLTNVHVQCAHCNVELDGNYEKYKEFILEHYGESMLNVLLLTRELYNSGKLKDVSKKDMLDRYDDYLENLRNIEKFPGEFVPVEWEKYRK